MTVGRSAMLLLAVVSGLMGCQSHVALVPAGTEPIQVVKRKTDTLQPAKVERPLWTVQQPLFASSQKTPQKVPLKTGEIQTAGGLQASTKPTDVPGDSVLQSVYQLTSLCKPPTAPADVLLSVDLDDQVDLDDRVSLDDEADLNDLRNLEGQDGGNLSPGKKPQEQLPIDLPAVLRLAGASNWGVLLAAERVREAQARWDAAKVLWLPSLNAGVGYTKHDGKIQATQGQVIDASRNSLFVGGGAVTSNAPTTGGSGGPARLFVDLSLADAIFEPLAARQLFCAERARESATFNDTLLAASLAFYDLADAQGRLAIARMDLKNSEEVQTLTEAFVAAGKGSRADVARAQVESAFRSQQVVRTEMNAKLASAELARILRLAPESLLYARDTNLVPVELVPESIDLSSLVAQGRTNRPELAENQAMVAAGLHRMRAERWRPIIPSIHVGASAGGFGGGVNDSLSFLDGRSDFDVLAVWQLRNLGFGTHVARQERSSQFRQAQLDYYRIQDLVTTEVTKAYHQVHAQRMQLSLAKANVEKALDSYRQNILRIRGLAGLPLEALQALQAVALARRAYLAALIEYNQAQLQLLRAIGQPISQ